MEEVICRCAGGGEQKMGLGIRSLLLGSALWLLCIWRRLHEDKCVLFEHTPGSKGTRAGPGFKKLTLGGLCARLFCWPSRLWLQFE